MLENVCLADFVAYYERTFAKKYADCNPLVEVDGEGEEVLEDISPSDPIQHLPQRAARYRRRKFAKVLQWVHFQVETHRPDYFHELLLLFRPWRNEDSEVNVILKLFILMQMCTHS